MIKPWTTVGSKPVGNFRIFTMRADRKVSPRNGTEHEVYILDSVDWVNVVAVTPDNHLVMIEQYRHGTHTIELEIPGGMVDEGENAVGAGLRELREETGYEGRSPRILGRIFPNPAIQTNTCFTLLVEDCERKHELELDHGEDLMTRLVPVSDVPALVAAGRIQHSLVVVALYYFDLWKRGLGSDEKPGPLAAAT